MKQAGSSLALERVLKANPEAIAAGTREAAARLANPSPQDMAFAAFLRRHYGAEAKS